MVNDAHMCSSGKRHGEEDRWSERRELEERADRWGPPISIEEREK